MYTTILHNEAYMWQQKVYKPRKDERYAPNMMVKEVFKRDNYQCQSCRKRFPVIELSCHHVIPRAEGGDNNPKNLITLCRPCHDLIELNEIKIVENIKYYQKRIEETKEDNIKNTQIIEDAERQEEGHIDWRTWVYGGQKRKQKGY